MLGPLGIQTQIYLNQHPRKFSQGSLINHCWEAFLHTINHPTIEEFEAEPTSTPNGSGWRVGSCFIAPKLDEQWSCPLPLFFFFRFSFFLIPAKRLGSYETYNSHMWGNLEFKKFLEWSMWNS